MLDVLMWYLYPMYSRGAVAGCLLVLWLGITWIVVFRRLVAK